MTRSLPFYSRRQPRARRIGPEAGLQITVVAHLQLRGVPGLLFHHPCNEGKRSESAGLFLKKMGMQPGISDLVITVPGKPNLYLELKARGGKQSLEQSEFEWAVTRAGHVYRLVDNIDDAIAVLEDYGALTRRERLSPSKAHRDEEAVLGSMVEPRKSANSIRQS